MAKVAIIGAGFAGHTTAMYVGSALGKDHEITMINMSDRFLYVPSLVWAGVGHFDVEKTRFPLKKVYDKFNVNFVHGKATEVHPDEQYVIAERRDNQGGQARVDYDYLVVATGPHLNFKGTPGLGPEHGNTYSICTASHTVQARDKFLESVERMKRGERQKIVVGTGHPGATCQGAAFEYITNIHKSLIKRGVRDKAELLYLSNERALGDFGVRGVHVKKNGRMFSSEEFINALFKEYGTDWKIQKGVKNVEKGKCYWEDYDGDEGETDFDFGMLIPQFTGMPMKYIGQDGEDVSAKVVNPSGFIIVDAIYGQPYEKMASNPDVWPGIYQNPNYKNIFAAGIAFAPPGPISVPHVNPNGMSISAAPPRTGMVSGATGKIVAENIIDLVKHGRMTHNERMTEMAAACIASMGDSMWDGSAAVIVVYPVVPNCRRYPNEEGRDMFVTHMEMGLAGAWMKRMIHTTFMHKLQGRIGWSLIPE
ncbi:FAD-dependent oxidoreductase [Anaerolineales bacterium HSG6]|nr:FAD-dependent oxidoreductase [Anaerolineales bacterium HSG6]MDM8531007.1 FAD-dependent oxidoreductase [Anaerolineales bacterium HSG25]